MPLGNYKVNVPDQQEGTAENKALHPAPFYDEEG